jgi:hypothetical protein
LQAKHLELLGPVARQIGKAREADAAGQAVVGDGLDQARGEKSQRELHGGQANGALLPLRKIGDVENPSRDELVEGGSGLAMPTRSLILVSDRVARASTWTPSIGGMRSRLTRAGRLCQAVTTVASPTILAASRVSAISIETVSDSGALDHSFDQPAAFGRHCVDFLKRRAALITAYAAGLRASEVAGLRISGIDSARGFILIRQGKGGENRNVILSPQLLGMICANGRMARPKTFLFPGGDEIARSIRRCCTPPAAGRRSRGRSPSIR